ncbi:MAG: hypothetical protein DRQ78_11215 [Epsilonproteobacteria bacterium]|nr:MAG: hypothetical protein DRQ78_11215 [Campylobacterota bacterium]
MGVDKTRIGFNSTTVDVVGVQGGITATDRAGVSLADGVYNVCRLPAGAIIQKVYLDRVASFDGTLPTISIGTEGVPAKYLAATATDAATLVVGALELDTKVSVAEDIVLTLVNGGSTAGEAVAYIEYLDTAARREIFTV